MNEIVAGSSRCIAIGLDTKIIPTGKCGECCSKELEMKLQDVDDEFLVDEKYSYPIQDKIKAIKSNPINRCIFCNNDRLCYFAGDCENKLPIK